MRRTGTTLLRSAVVVLIVLLCGCLLLPSCADMDRSTSDPGTTYGTTQPPADGGGVDDTSEVDEDPMPPAPTWEETIAAVEPWVVKIQVQTAWGEGWGSGVIIDKEGYILTNQHVVGGVSHVMFRTQDSSMYWAAVVIGRDPDHDLALLKVVSYLGRDTTNDPSHHVLVTWHPPEGEPPAFGDASTLRKGEEVKVLGFPGSALEDQVIVTSGVVSALTSEIVQTDAPLNPGNSGGPLINLDGEIVGVCFAKAVSWYSPPIEGIGFAVAAGVVEDNLVRLKSGFFGVNRPVPGWTISGAARLNTNQQRQLDDITQRYGIRVSSVRRGYGAYAAGMEGSGWRDWTWYGGDIVVSIDGDSVQSYNDYRAVVDKLPVGREVSITYFRGNELRSAAVVLLEDL